jgi:hypothetical protein
MAGLVLSHPFRDEAAERMGHGNKMQVLRLGRFRDLAQDDRG